VRRQTVLVVEDDRQLREMYVAALEANEVDVVAVGDGHRALLLVDEQPPDLIVLDLSMPCVDGWTVQRELASKESTRHIPIIIVSAETDLELAALQASAILRKPCVLDDLVAAVEDRLSNAA
jgi:two-component system phosphate regulon response regulator PhoB